MALRTEGGGRRAVEQHQECQGITVSTLWTNSTSALRRGCVRRKVSRSRGGEGGEKGEVDERDTVYVEVEYGTRCSDNEGGGSVGIGSWKWFEW